MRGADTLTESLFTMRRLDDFLPADHPLRPIRVMVNQALVKMNMLFMLQKIIRASSRLSSKQNGTLN